MVKTFRSCRNEIHLLKSVLFIEMSLSEAVAAYLNAWDGHTNVEGELLMNVVDLLTRVSLDQLRTEINALTQQTLWVTPLMDVFYDELLYRIMNDTTFCISTAWTSVRDWLTHPYVTVQVGLNDSYFVLDEYGNPITYNQPYQSYTLMNASFPERTSEELIRLFLDDNIIALCEIGNTITIVGLESTSDSGRRILFAEPGNNIVRVPAQIREIADWNGIKTLYEGLRKNHPVIVDPQREVLINQLIDYPEALDIIAEGGITYEDLDKGLIEVDTDTEREESEFGPLVG